MRKAWDIFELILIATMFIRALFTEEWQYCYIALMLLTITVLSDIQSENAWIFDDKKHDKKTIAITTKMLEFAENSSQLEGIIAHELGHYFVSQRYDNPKAAINEKMADQHALDCLYYMGKNPDEYSVVFERLFGLYEMNDAERILAGLADEHGSPTSRLQDIDNYNEARFGDYIEDLDDDTHAQVRMASDDQAFSEFKSQIKSVYAEDCFVGTLEASLMQEESLKSFISAETGRIDITQIPYEQVLDILITKADDEHFISSHSLEEAAELLAHSSKQDLELNDRITTKVNTLLEKASTSVLLHGHNYKEISLKQNIRDNTYSYLNGEYRETSFASIIKAEAEANGETITAEQLAEKIEQALVENNLTITEESQEVTYHGHQFWLGEGHDDTTFLLLDRANSPALSSEIKERRGEILNRKVLNHSLLEEISSNLHHDEQREFIDTFDKLTFAAAYPSLDLEAYTKDYATAKNDAQRDQKEQAFLNEVMSTPHLTIKPISSYESELSNWKQNIDAKDKEKAHLSTIGDHKIPLYSRLAIDLPAFEMPPAENALGTTLPWAHLDYDSAFKKFGLTLDEDIRPSEATAKDFTPTTEFSHFKEVITLVKFADGKPYEFAADENGKIIAIGEEAKALKQQATDNKQNKDTQISANFDKNIHTLNALTAVSLLSQTSQTRPLNENEIKILSQSLHYLTEAPDLEPYLLKNEFGHLNYQDEELKKVRELNYTQMPETSPQIDKDFETLHRSIFYQQFFADDKNKELSRAEKRERLIAVQNWQAKDKTVLELQTIAPVIAKVIDQREAHATKENTRFYAMYEKSQWRIQLSKHIESLSKHLPDAEKEQIIPTILDIKTKDIENAHNLLEINDKTDAYPANLGTYNDELVYTKTSIPYYEVIRQKLKLRETKGNPHVLYANLTSKIESSDDVAPNRSEQLSEKIERNKKYGEQKEDGRFWISGYAKLNSHLTSNDHKLAEYEVMRYINDPTNPPLNCQKLLTAFPRYGFTNSPIDTAPGCTDAFRQALGTYILEKSNFKELNFYQQREIYELMLNKDLFDKKNANKIEFLEALKKSYQKLPETEKADAALSMLQDKTFTFQTTSDRGISSYDFLVGEKTETKTMADYPPIRNFFIAEYAERFAQKIGKEPIIGEEKADGASVTKEDYLKYQQQITSFINMVNNTTTAAPDVKEILFAHVADKIEAQAETAKRFEVGSKHFTSDNDMSAKNEISLRLTSSINEFLKISAENNIAVIDFLTAPYSPESAEKFKHSIYEHTVESMPLLIASYTGESPKPLDEETTKQIKEELLNLTNEDLCITHADFWDKTLEERSILMQRLLENATGNNIDKSVDLVTDKYLKPEEPYYKEAKDVLKTLYKTGAGVGHYRKNKARFMLGAMLSAQEPTKENTTKNMGIGQALALFCSANGPAWVKFGQALSNIPNLPDDIRKPLSILKDRAVSKKRWELFKELEQNLPKEKFGSIKKVGKVLGAGSFFSSIGIELKDGSKHVLQMMAPQAEKKAKSEFKKIIRSIKDLTQIDKMYAVLNKIVERADESTKTEVNIQKGYEQYVEAAKNYAMIDELEVNGIKFKLHLVPWTDKHQDKDGNGFKQMEFAGGKSLSRIDCSPEEKRALAAGYVATELGVLLSGKAWDIDRHNGQQNFSVTRDKEGKITEVEIGIFDTGALRPAPNEQDKALIANFYAAVLRASVKGDDINDVMFKEVQNLEDKGVNASYVSDVQRGCIALSDLCEYQKEERDAKGNITQTSQSLSQGDYLSIFGAVINSGLIDHKIIDPLITKLVTDKKVIAAIAKQQAQQKFGKLKKVISGNAKKEPKIEELHITMSAKGCLATKEQDKQIDKIKDNPVDNEFRAPTQTIISKREKRGNKLSRMLQAAYIKHTRRNK